jgi:hypothetical protein
MNKKSLGLCTRYWILFNTFMLLILFTMISSLKTLSLIQSHNWFVSLTSVRLYSLILDLKPFWVREVLLSILRQNVSKELPVQSSMFGHLASFLFICFREWFTLMPIQRRRFRAISLGNLLFSKVILKLFRQILEQ